MLQCTKELLKEQYGISENAMKIINRAEQEIASAFNGIDQIRQYNQIKVLAAFKRCKVEQRHFLPSTGYGYDDNGRDTLDKLYAEVFNCQSAIVSPMIASGTHAIYLALTALLRPGDTLLFAGGKPYDTLEPIIGLTPSSGSLEEWGISYKQTEIACDGTLDIEQIKEALSDTKCRAVLLQRSKGYAWRPSLSINDIKAAVKEIRQVSPETVILVDNCYGEFCYTQEPTDAGVDIIIGSLIKNPGGGIAPTGAYIAGKEELITQVAHRLTAPGIGREVGSYAAWYLPFFQGLFLAPHVAAEALKGAVLCSKVFEALGYDVLPSAECPRTDIIQAVKFGNSEALISFIKAIQRSAPVDSHVVPEPWNMPGYQDPVIMAAGTFIQGASIELSADAPIRPPYIAYMQGGLTYDHVKFALMLTAQGIM